MGFSLPMNEWWLQPWGASGWGRDSRKTRARLEGWNFQPHALTSREERGLETGLIIKADEFIHHAYVKKKKPSTIRLGELLRWWVVCPGIVWRVQASSPSHTLPYTFLLSGLFPTCIL